MAKSKRIVEAAIAVVLFVGCAGSVLAQDVATAVSNRQAAMKAIGGASGALRGGDPAAIRAAGKTIGDNLATFGANLPAGSGPESGQKTRAKAEIWSDSAGFKAAVSQAVAAADGLAKVGDDPAAITAAGQAMQQACGGCHAKYRGPAV
jgi:cytochrome c556